MHFHDGSKTMAAQGTGPAQGANRALREQSLRFRSKPRVPRTKPALREQSPRFATQNKKYIPINPPNRSLRENAIPHGPFFKQISAANKNPLRLRSSDAHNYRQMPVSIETMKLWYKLIVTFVVIPAGAVGFFYYLNQKGFFNLNQIEIVIEDSSQAKQALKKSVERLDQQLELLRGQPLWSLKLSEVSAQLGSEKWIHSFHITRRWPATLQLTVKPEAFYFVYMNKEAQILPVMENGYFLDALKPGEAPDLPIAVGNDFEKSFEVRTKAIEILKQIPMHGTFSRQTISEIHHDMKGGFSFMLLQNGLRIKIGEERVRTKSFRISKVLDYLDSKKFQARVIDANLSQKVLVRLRKDP